MSSLFEVDFELLDDRQRSMLRNLARQDGAPPSGDSSAVQELQQLGLLTTDGGSGLRVALPLLRDWLAGLPG